MSFDPQRCRHFLSGFFSPPTLTHSLLVGLVNLVLDPLLMFTFKLGVAGAAQATAAAQWIGALSYAIKVGNSRWPAHI